MTDHEAQRVTCLSLILRLEVCWHGRQEIRAVIASFDSGADAVDAAVEAIEVRCEDFVFDLGVRVRSTSSHQSSSVQAVTPESLNHFLRPSGTKKCASG